MEEPNNIPPIDFYKYKSPVTNPSNAELQKIKKEEFLFKWGIRLVLFFGFVMCGGIAFILYLYNPLDSGNNGDAVQEQPIPTVIPERVDDYRDTQYETKTKKVLPQGVDDYRRPELDLMNLLLDEAIEKRWSGEITDNIGIVISDFNINELNDIILAQQKISPSRPLPDKVSAYFGSGSEKEIEATIKEARTKYIDFLKEYGVKEQYINELTDYVLPTVTGRLSYVGSNEGYVVPLSNSDYSRIQIGVSDADIIEKYYDLSNTAFAGKYDDDLVLTYAIELATYEKLGFAVMQAYVNQHVSLETRNQGEENMWLEADINYLKNSKNYYWAWDYNDHIHNARVSNGLAFIAFSQNNDLNEFQQADLYDFIWEKENENSNRLNEIALKLHNHYDNLLLNGIDKIPNIMYDQVFAQTSDAQTKKYYQEMFKSLENLSIQIGRQYPAQEKDLLFLKK